MLAVVHGAVLSGVTSYPVRVEVQTARGIPAFELVGLAEAAVRESRVRVRSALAGVGVDISEVRITVNLAPADVRKTGSAFDLAIALGALVSLGQLPETCLDDVLLLGELSLNGSIQALRGVLPHLVGARSRGVKRAIVPLANEREASLVDDVAVELAGSLADVVERLRAGGVLRAPERTVLDVRSPVEDLSDVRGQHGARRALEIAASGGHNLLMMGPPGAGKTMLARRLPGVLPLLSRSEALDVLAIHSVAGLVDRSRSGVERPFRAPHHTVSDVALVGGGENARPGEVSLAHHGVLFLDELAEFRRSALEALRQPLEDGAVTVTRMRHVASFPARPMIVGATNPCPCGLRGDGTEGCRCRDDEVRLYRRRLSGPLLDRLDVHVALPRVDVMSLDRGRSGEATAAVRARVERARAAQMRRFEGGEVSAIVNAALTQRDAEKVCRLDAKGRDLLSRAVERRGMSARAFGKVLRVARTIADMDGATAIALRHVSEALLLRVFDRMPGDAPQATDAA